MLLINIGDIEIIWYYGADHMMVLEGGRSDSSTRQDNTIVFGLIGCVLGFASRIPRYRIPAVSRMLIRTAEYPH